MRKMGKMENYEYTKAVFDDFMKLIDSDKKISLGDYVFFDKDDEPWLDNEALCAALLSLGRDNYITTPDYSKNSIYNEIQAQKMVCENIDTVIEALNAEDYDAETVGNYFMEENYIQLDTIAREYVLSDAIGMVELEFLLRYEKIYGVL